MQQGISVVKLRGPELVEVDEFLEREVEFLERAETSEESCLSPARVA